VYSTARTARIVRSIDLARGLSMAEPVFERSGSAAFVSAGRASAVESTCGSRTESWLGSFVVSCRLPRGPAITYTTQAKAVTHVDDARNCPNVLARAEDFLEQRNGSRI
jgi:hypothetical protein